jgi:hypothetical protein
MFFLDRDQIVVEVAQRAEASVLVLATVAHAIVLAAAAEAENFHGKQAEQQVGREKLAVLKAAQLIISTETRTSIQGEHGIFMNASNHGDVREVELLLVVA